MLFHSLEFILAFLPVVLAGYAFLSRSGRTQPVFAWLTLASLVFYAWWNPPFVVLLIASILGNWQLGNRLLQHPRRSLLWVGILGNLAVLGYFKYANFFLETLNSLAGTHWSAGSIFLPLGISFFTFQQIAWLVDAYTGQARRSGLLDYALFVSFFPQLIAGPIVHHREMMPQFARRSFRVDPDDLVLGLGFFSVGLFKKLVIADGMAAYATPVFDAALAGQSPTLFEAWGGALAYTFQLYFDFSGYSDMAIGLALLFGIRLPLNFASPYKATNIIEFWRRWHMTLSRFLRDYVYIPLGGGRHGAPRRYLNLMTTMLLGGLWHGAAWTFVAWGALHGLYLMVVHLFHALRRAYGQDPARTTRAGRFCAWLLTFLAVVVGWVLFRAESFDAASRVLAGMAGLNGVVVPEEYRAMLGPLGELLASMGWRFAYVPGFLFDGWRELAFLSLVAVIAFLAPNTQEWFGYRGPGEAAVPATPSRRLRVLPDWLTGFRPGYLQGTAFGLLFGALLLSLLAETPREFLYFQF
jgi:D-alanyl-lipoteichoic acid acyltransferase DltB (MBOAT superfamily)